MSTWLDGPILGFDTETTGVNTDTDRIVTAALVRRAVAGDPRSETTTRTWLINPGVPIPPGASAIHGISTEYAAEHGRPPSEALAEIAEAITVELRAGVPLTAFNASFDVPILENELRRNGLPTIADRLGQPTRPVVDPLVIDRAVDKYRKGKRKLGDLAVHYEVIQEGELHTAEVDVLVTLDILAALAARNPQMADLHLTDLHDWQASAHRDWAAGFNAWRISRGLDGAGASLEWL